MKKPISLQSLLKSLVRPGHPGSPSSLRSVEVGERGLGDLPWRPRTRVSVWTESFRGCLWACGLPSFVATAFLRNVREFHNPHRLFVLETGKLRPRGFWELVCPTPGLESLGLLTPYSFCVSVKLLLLGCCGCWRGAGAEKAQRFSRCGARTHSLAPLALHHCGTREEASGGKKKNQQTNQKKSRLSF